MAPAWLAQSGAGSRDVGALRTDAARKRRESLPPTSEIWLWLPALAGLLQSRRLGNCLRYLEFFFFALVRPSSVI